MAPRREASQWLCPSAELSWWPHLDRELSWQFCLIWVLSQHTIPAMELVIWPCPGREANSQSYLTASCSLHSHSTRKPNKGTQIAMEPIQWPHLDRDLSPSLSQLLRITSGPKKLETLGSLRAWTTVPKSTENTPPHSRAQPVALPHVGLI